jgi:hypothetical protein
MILLGGCRIFSPIPDMRTAADHAHEVEARCKTEPGRPVDETLPVSAIDSVRPAYSYVHSGPVDPEARLRGASIHVRPLPGMGKESLGRTLECHQVAVTLGGLPLAADDPYVLPDRWLDIDVDSDRDGFVVQVRADDFESARQVLDRAKLFYARKSAAPPGPVPGDAGTM